MILIPLLLIGSVAQIFSVLVYSELTPSELVTEFSDLIANEHGYYISMLPMSKTLIQSLETLELNAIFDYTFCTVHETELKMFSYSHHVLYFLKRAKFKEKWVFSLHSSPQLEVEAIQKFLDYLDWKDYHLVSSEKQENRYEYQLLTNEPLLVISSTVDQKIYDNFIGRSVKPTGNWKVMVMMEYKGAYMMLKALKNLKIYKERCALIVIARGIWGPFETGTIVLAEEGLKFSRSEGEYEFKSILKALDALDALSRQGSITDNERLRTLLEENTEDHTISRTFTIGNYNPDFRIIGNITDTVNIYEQIVYPGNVTQLTRTPPIINISGNLGQIEYDGSFALSNYITSLAIAPMIHLINQDTSILTNFVLEIHGTDCGAERYNYAYTAECMKRHIDSLGVFYIDSMFERIGKANIQIFREHGITIPHTGIYYNSLELYDRKKYPELYITNAQNLYIYSILPYIINSFRWNEILVYFQDDVTTSLFNAFMQNAEILEIQVKNKIMMIPQYPNTTFEKANKETLKEAVNSKCRIFVLLVYHQSLMDFLEALYDSGLRRGDVVVITNVPMSTAIEYDDFFKHDKEKVKEMADGSLSLAQKEYTGEYGTQLQQTISQFTAPLSTNYTCFQIDSLLLGVYTIDLMLKIGRDYEDPTDMNYFMRQQHFTGCSGTVSIDSGGNGRNELTFGLLNFYIKNGNWTEDSVGYYTIGITVPLNISKGIVWPGGSTEIPGDMRVKPECGIKKSKIKHNTNSIMITVYGSIAYFAILIGVCIAVWCKSRIPEHERILSRRELMFEDGVEMATPFIEGSMYIGLGPGYSIFHFLSYLVGLDSFLRFENGMFWKVFFVFSGISFVWSCCAFFLIILLDQRFPRLLKNLTRYIGLTFFPLFSKLGLFFFLWILLRLYECKEGGGDDATEAFLKDDCDLRCWKGFHLGFAIPLFFVLTVYSIMSLVMGIVYDDVMDHINIKTDALFSIVKTIFKISLCFLHFHLKEMFPNIFTGCYFSFLLLWTLFCLKKESFNYVRLILWQEMVSIGVCCHFIVAIIGEFLGTNKLVIVILDLLLILGLSSLVLWIQLNYVTGYFYKRKGRDFNKLLKFAFTNRMKARNLTQHELDYKDENIRHSIRIEIGNRRYSRQMIQLDIDDDR